MRGMASSCVRMAQDEPGEVDEGMCGEKRVEKNGRPVAGVWGGDRGKPVTLNVE